jgi:uncharacterized small protein (DUF1192 family)
MSQTIYARVPADVKQAADDYAVAQGKTLASAVAELLDRGLQAAGDEHSVAELERRVATLGAEAEQLRQRDQAVSSAYAALAQRTAGPIGTCPTCGSRITGRDLLISGQCPNAECGASLTVLLDTAGPKQLGKGGLNDGDFKMLLAALGLLLGIALISQGAGGG